MPSWDKYEVLWFNARVLLLLAWPMWALLGFLLSFNNPPWSSSIAFIGSTSPLKTFWKGTGRLSVGVLPLFQKTASLLKHGGLVMEGQSFAVKGIFVICILAVGTTILVMTGAFFIFLEGTCSALHHLV